MESIKDKVAIIGMGCTKFGENWEQNGDDMIVDAVHEALGDAGIEIKDVQAAWVATRYSGNTSLCLSEPLKLQYVPVTRDNYLSYYDLLLKKAFKYLNVE